MTPAQIQGALDVAVLRLSTATTPAARREAFDELCRLKAEEARDKEHVRELERARGLG